MKSKKEKIKKKSIDNLKEHMVDGKDLKGGTIGGGSSPSKNSVVADGRDGGANLPGSTGINFNI